MQKTAGRFLFRMLKNNVLGILLCAALPALVSCSADSGSSGGGSLSFKVQWQEAPGPRSAAAALAPLDCSASGVSLVAATVYDSNNAVTATGGPWACAARGGSITKVPPGSNLKVLILGTDAGGAVRYRGEQIGLTVSNGQHVNAGIIVVSFFTPALISPSDGASLTASGLQLFWAGAGNSYQVQVSSSDTFVSPVIDVTSPIPSYTPPTPLADGTYYWRVRSIDDHGNMSAWSTVSSFSVVLPPPPSAPVLSAPLDGSTVANSAFSFTWAGLGSSYRIQVSADSAFGSPAIDDTSANASYAQKILLSAGTYYWRVNAVDALGRTSGWSNVSSFTVSSAACTAPDAPAGVSAASGVSRTTVTWNAVPGALSYNIRWSTTAGTAAGGTPITGVSSPYSHAGLVNGTAYYYVVTAVNVCGESGASVEASAIPAALVAPTLVAPSNGTTVADGAVAFSWAGAGNSYQVQVALSSAFNPPVLDAASLTTSYTPAATLAAGTTYNWRVKSIDAYGAMSDWSAVSSFSVAFPPPPPAPVLSAPLDGSTVTNGAFSFTWTGSGSSYRIQVSPDSAFGSPAIDDTSASASYKLKQLLTAGTYYWRVQASNAYGNAGGWSNVFSFTVASAPCTAPSAPTGVSAASGASRTTVTWNAVPGALSYNIRWSTTAGTAAGGTPITGVSSPYSHTGLANGTAYYYIVTAVNVCGESGASVEASAIPAALVAPTLVAPSNGTTVADGAVAFFWTGAGNSYQVQVALSSAFNPPVLDAASLTTSYTPAATLAAGTTYYWRVKSIDAYGAMSDWSMVSIFSVALPPPPPAPVLSEPSDGSMVTNGAFSFTWTGSGSSYRIQVSPDTAFGSPAIDDTSANGSYLPKKILSAGTYYWRVNAADAFGRTSDWSNVLSFTVSSAACTAPNAPSGVSAASGMARTTVTWNAVAGALSYNIHWSTTAGTAAGGAPITGVSSPYSHTGLANGTAYYYVVTAVNVCGEGAASSEVSATPALIVPALLAPANGATVPNAGLTFSWQNTGSAYHLQVSADPAFGTSIIDVASQNSTYVSPNVLQNGLYYWHVQATDANNNVSPWSEVRSFTATACLIPDVSLIQVDATPGDGLVRLRWRGGLNAPTSFNLYFSTSPDLTTANGTKITGVSPGYTHTGLINGVTYYYIVTGVNSCGEGQPTQRKASATPCSGCIPAF